MKCLIYTVLTGKNYDNILQPQVIDEDFDYILFSDNKKIIGETIGVWNVRGIDCNETSDIIRLSRFPKLCPHHCLSEYEYSMYIDANVQIVNSEIYNIIKEKIRQGVKLAMIKHPFRDCCYQEAYVCIASGKANIFPILRHILFLKVKGVKKNNGLFEANVILRRHNDELIKKIDETWWKTFCKYSKRDQLSLVYSLKKYNLKPTLLLLEGMSTRNHPSFIKVVHNASSGKTEKKGNIFKVFWVCMMKKILKEKNE